MRSVRGVAGCQTLYSPQLLRVCPSPTHVNGIVLRMLQADRSRNKTHSAKIETNIINRKKTVQNSAFHFPAR